MFFLLLITCKTSNTKYDAFFISTSCTLQYCPVRDVVFVHNSLRLADKLVDIDYDEKTVEWAESDSDNESDDD